MSRVFLVEAMEEELLVGPADGDGVGAGGVLDVGVVYLEVEGAVHPHEEVELMGA
jgi:hypothetical protein